MTEKRFTLTNPKNTFQEMKCGIDDRGNTLTFNEVVDLLNELAEEKKELQVQCNLLREQANEFHRGARENANRVGQLEKENKELKVTEGEMEDYLARMEVKQ